MKHIISLKWVLSFSVILTLSFSSLAFAWKPMITSSFSGIWDQPEQEAQGIILQIGEQGEDEKVGIAYWFTYGPDLNTQWYLGVGPVTGNTIDMLLYTASDVGFMAASLEDANENVLPIGTLNLEFHNCNQGTATYTLDEMTGEEGEVIVEADEGDFPIKRISSIYHQRCSGGMSDDTPKNGKPLDLSVDLLPVAEDSNAKGKAKFWERTERVDFKVAVENLDDGTYTLEICGGTDEVVDFDLPVVMGEGELEFRSPVEEGKEDLNFDPRDCKIEVLSGEDVVLTSGDEVLSEKSNGKSGD